MVVVCGLWFLRKIRPTQLWVELSWVVAINQKTYSTNKSKDSQGKVFKEDNLELVIT